MADNDILFKAGIDTESLIKVSEDIRAHLAKMRLGELVGKGLSEGIIAGAQDGAKSIAATLRLAASKAQLGELIGKEIAKGAADGAASITTAMRLAAAQARTQIITGSSYATAPVGTAAGFANFPQTAKNITANAPDINQRFADLHTALTTVAADQVKLKAVTDGTTGAFKSMAFSIGLVGYGMENVGRRLIGFTEQLFAGIKHVATATEQFERLKNALVIEGVPEDERNSIVARIKQISLLPGGKLQEVTKSFQEIRTAGLGVAESLSLIQGLTKATTISGKGTQGVEQAVKVLRRALLAQENPFKTQTLDTLEAQVGPQIAAAMLRAFGSVDAKTLNKVGGQAAVTAIIAELGKLGDALPVTVDSINHIEDSLLRIGDSILHVLGPALDSVLDNFLKLEDIVEGLEKRFEALSQPKKNFISGLASVIPTVLVGLGSILSLLGVLAVSAAILGKTWRLYDETLLVLGKRVGFVTEAVTETGKTIPVLAEGVTKLTLFGIAGEKLRTIFAPVLAIFKNLGGIFSVTEGAGLTVGLGVFEGSLGKIAGVLGKITGFIPGLGTLINLILAYITNAGNARDNINGAFSLLYNSFVRLYDKISSFLSGPGAALLKLFTVISDLIGGVLGDAFSALVGSLSSIVDALTDFFTLFTDPSLENVQKFLDDLYQASVGWVEKLGKLLAASFLEAIASIGDNPSTGSRFVFGILPDVVNELGTSGIRKVAQGLRESVFPGGAHELDLINKNLKTTLDEATKINQELARSKQLVLDFEQSTAKLATSFARTAASIARAQIKVSSEAQTKASLFALTQLGDEDVDAALRKLPDIFANNLHRQLADLRAEAKQTIITAAESLSVAESQIIQAQSEMTDFAPTEQAGTRMRAFLDVVNAIAGYGKNGNLDNKGLAGLAQKLVTTANIVATTFIPNGEAGQKQMMAFNQAVKEFYNSTAALNSQMAAHSVATINATAANKDAEQAERRRLEIRKEEIEATKKLQPFLVKEAELKIQLGKDQDALKRPFGTFTPEELDVINNRIVETTRGLDTVKKQIDSLKKGRPNQLNAVVADNQKAVDDLSTSAENAATSTEVLSNQVEALADIFREGFKDLDDFHKKLDDINQLRIEMGLPALGVPPNTSVANRLSIETQPLFEILRSLHGELTSNALEIAVENIGRGILLNAEGFKNLKNLALETIESLTKAEGAITLNQGSIDRAQVAFDVAPEGPGKVEAQKHLDETKKRQIALTTETAKYAEILKIINLILKANEVLVSETFKNAKQQNEVEKAQLDARQKRLDLELELIQAQAANAVSHSQAPGGIPNPNIQGVEDSLNNQLQQIENIFSTRKSAIEQERIERLAAAEAAKLSEQQTADINDELDRRLNVLQQIHDLEVDSAKLDAEAAAINSLADAFEKLTSISGTFSNFTKDLLAFITDLTLNGKKIVHFSDLVADAFYAIGASFANALANSLSGGDGFLTGMKKFMGQLLVQVGSMLISLGAAALALAALAIFFPIIVPPQFAIGIPAAIAAIAVGSGLVVAGALLGGGSAPAKTADKNATNNANSTAGAVGTGFDPLKDPKTIFQKALMAHILIDIKTDSAQIVKTVIKTVNNNGRLATLIGNRKLQFGY